MSIAFVFPGQGSQSVGMLNSFDAHPTVRRVIDQSSAACQEDLWALATQGPENALNLTTITQPLMLAAGYALFCAWREAGGGMPAIMAGHSLGEYTALCAAGCFELEDAIRVVSARAQAMQAAVPAGDGAMAAILGMSDDAVVKLCAQVCQQHAGRVVEAVNFNAPSQVVIAGHADAVALACAEAKAQGAKRALTLPVSAPFHSTLMRPAAETLQTVLSLITLRTPAVDVINNVDVSIEREPQAIAGALIRQAWQPVRWVELIQHLKTLGVRHIVECGPGKVLTNLNKRIDTDLTNWSIFDVDSLNEVLARLPQA